MNFQLRENGNPSFGGIHPLLAELLRAVALDPWERYPDGSLRLLPSPGEGEALRLDWEDFVQPELRCHFDTERSLITRDLEGMKTEEGENASFLLEIPLRHIDAWLTTLNALRLSIVAEYCFSEKDLSGNRSADLLTERGLALMQVSFYAFIQECLIQTLEADRSAGE